MPRGNDLLDGFKTGFGIFEKRIEHNLRMKQLKSQQEHETSEATAERYFRSKESKNEREHRESEGDAGRSSTEKIAAESNKAAKQRLDAGHKFSKGQQKALFGFQRGESKKERDTRLKLLKTELTSKDKQGKLNRNQQKVLAKLNNTSAMKRLDKTEKGLNKRSAANIKANKDSQGRAHKQQSKEGDADRTNRTDINNADNKAAKDRLDTDWDRRDAAPTPFEKSVQAQGDAAVNYQRLVETIQDPNTPIAQRREASARASAMHNSMQIANNAAHTAATKGDLQSLTQWTDYLNTPTYGVAGPPPAGFPGQLPGAKEYRPPATNINSGWNAQGAGNTPAGNSNTSVNTQGGRANRANRALTPSPSLGPAIGQGP
jgi:hypothetical protein